MTRRLNKRSENIAELQKDTEAIEVIFVLVLLFNDNIFVPVSKIKLLIDSLRLEHYDISDNKYKTKVKYEVFLVSFTLIC